MVFEFSPDERFDFLTAFAQHIGTTLQDHTVTLPHWLGVGSIRRVRLAPGFSLLIHQYTLADELILRRTAADNTADRVNVLFQASDYGGEQNDATDAASITHCPDYSVRVTSPDINSELYFPPGRPIIFLVLSMNRAALHELLRLSRVNGVVEQILKGTQAFLFYETLSVDAHQLLRTLVAVDTRKDLAELRIWIQVQTLICWLFERLLTRDTRHQRPIHRADADGLSQVRAAVVANLSVPPQLTQLAQSVGMSTSKLTDLFRQVFGASIYDYYQQARMAEAGRLLREAGYSVSETGHRLGFSNLSHFGRLFEKHYGAKPKRYATDR